MLRTMKQEDTSTAKQSQSAMPRSPVPDKRHPTDGLRIYKRDRATDEPGMRGPAFQPGCQSQMQGRTRLGSAVTRSFAIQTGLDCLSDLYNLALFLLLVFLPLCDLDSEMRHIVWPLKPFLHEFLLSIRLKFPSPLCQPQSVSG